MHYHGNAENLGKLLDRKNYYFIPMEMNNPITKPYSLVCNFDYTIKTVKEALKQKQLFPILIIWLQFT